MITGIDYNEGTRILTHLSTTASNNRYNSENQKDTKYLQVTKPGEYLIRVVSGYVPFQSHFIPELGYKICPKTLLMSVEKYDETGKKFNERIHLKEDHTIYSDAEAFCPVCAKDKPQVRYAINVIDRDEQANNPNGPVPIRIISGPFALFKNFIQYRSSHTPYAPSDAVRGPNFLVRTFSNIVGGKTKIDYMVNDRGSVPLTEQELLIVGDFKTKENNGVWDLVLEYHPYKCSKKMAIDNGVNPKFKEPDKVTSYAQTAPIIITTEPQQTPYIPPIVSQPQYEQLIPQQQPQQYTQPASQQQPQQQYAQPAPPQQPQQYAQPAPQQQPQQQYIQPAPQQPQQYAQPAPQQQPQQQYVQPAQQQQPQQQYVQPAPQQYAQQPIPQQTPQIPDNAMNANIMQTQIKETSVKEVSDQSILDELLKL